MYRPNLQSVALAVPEIIVIAVLGWVVNPQSWRRGGRRGSGMAPFERAFLTSYRLSIVTFPLSLRVSVLHFQYCNTAHNEASQVRKCRAGVRQSLACAWGPIFVGRPYLSEHA